MALEVTDGETDSRGEQEVKAFTLEVRWPAGAAVLGLEQGPTAWPGELGVSGGGLCVAQGP